MDSHWNDSQPIYRQLRDKVVAMILEGTLGGGRRLAIGAQRRRRAHAQPA